MRRGTKMNNWKLKAWCALAILRGRGVIYGIHFTKEVRIHSDQQNSIIVNSKFGPMPLGPLNTDKILAGLETWVKGQK